MSNFVEIALTAAEIWWLFDFSRCRPPPSCICDTCVGTTHERHVVVFINVQNLVGNDAVVLIITMHIIRISRVWLKNAYSRPKIVFWLPKWGSMWTNPNGHIVPNFESAWFERSCVKISRRVWPVSQFPKRSINKNNFTHVPRSPPWTDVHLILHSCRGRRRNHLWQIFGDRLRGVYSVCRGRKLPCPIDKASRLWCLYLRFQIFTARRYASAVYAVIACQSVCLS